MTDTAHSILDLHHSYHSSMVSLALSTAEVMALSTGGGSSIISTNDIIVDDGDGPNDGVVDGNELVNDVVDDDSFVDSSDIVDER